MTDYEASEVRKFLKDYFDDTEFQQFCHDYFREVSLDFTVGMTKSQKIEHLIGYCERHEKSLDLHTSLQKERPEQYTDHFGKDLLPENSIEEAPSSGRDDQLVFISYAYEDTTIAHKLASDLSKAGSRIWMAPDSIRPGEKWHEAINRGLETCSRFIVVLTKKSVNSSWVVDETNIAIDMQREGKLLFIPVQFEECKLPALWSNFQYIPFQNYDLAMQQLLPALRGEFLRINPVKSPTKHIRKKWLLIMAISILVLSFTALGLWMGRNSEFTSQCPPKIGQIVHIAKGINAWSKPEVTSGGITKTFDHQTPVYIINGKEWGIIVYGTDVSGWWWEVSDVPNGKSLGWVWEGQIDECAK